MGAAMPIAVVGIAARVPGADDYHRFWRNLLGGVDSVGAVPADRWPADGPASEGLGADARRAMGFGGFVTEIDLFDAGFFGVAAAEAAKMDPKQRLALECAWRAMEDAGLTADDLRETETGVFVGTSVYDYYELLMQDPRNVDGYVGVGNFNCIVPNRISYLLDLHGPSIAVETACSASLTALHLACQSIRTGECDQAFAGGAMVMLSPYVARNFASGNFLSPDGRCHAFGAEANGYVRGEGAGMVLLKPLAAAQEAGDHVHAVVLGSSCNQDGRSNGLTAPNPLAQERLLRRAHAAAGVAAAEIDYVEAHGTGTPLGDPIEAKALGKVMSEGRASDAPCLIGSVKSNIGHLEAAAGIAGFIKAVLAIKHGVIPPTLHAGAVNPRIDLDALKLALPMAAQRWPGDGRRLAGVSSFSFGGSNAHAVLANAPTAVADVEPWPLETLVLSARSAEALEALADTTARALRTLGDAIAFSVFCSAAARGRKAYRHRLALVAASAETAAMLLERRREKPAGLWRGEATGRAPALVLAFSGQGIALAGAGADLRAIPVFRETFAACEAAVADRIDVPIGECLWGDRTDLLADTHYAQPVLLAFSLALHAIWRSWGVSGAVLIGHSLGEYAAAVAAGVFAPADAMRLVAERGAAMAAMEPGGMIALHCSLEAARALVDAHPHLSVAAENAPQLIVVSGPEAALATLGAAAAVAGVAMQRLPAGCAFHSACVDPVLPALTTAATATPASAPRVVLISNVTAAPITGAPDPAYWADHARQPVRFADGLAAARAAGAEAMLEIGPGCTLAGLARRHPAWTDREPIASLATPAAGRAGLAAALARLFVAGATVDWDAVFAGRPRRHDALPGHPFMRARHWFEHPDRRQPAAATEPCRRDWRVDGRERDLMTQHVLHGRPVMPAASFIGYMLAALQESGAHRLSDLALVMPLPVPEQHDLRFTTDVEAAAADGRRRVRLIGDDGTVHARGLGENCLGGTPTALPTVVDVPRSDGAVEVRYASLARQGIAYGPAFRTLRSLAVADGIVVATVAPGIEPDQPPMLAAAALLDGCFQALGRDAAEHAYIPVHVGLVEAMAAAGPPASLTAILTSVDDGEAMVADLDIADAAGRPAIRIRRLRLQAIAAVARPSLDRSMLLLPTWRETAPPPGPLPDRSPAAVVAGLSASAEALAAALDLAGYAAALDRLDRRAAHAATVLAARQVPAETAHGRALERRFAGMAAVLDQGPALPASAVGDDLASAEARTLARCVSVLPEVLAGRIDPLIPLFADDGADAAAIYGDAPAGRYFNRLCGEVLRSAADAAGRRLRVLEVGAGTCATTQAILAAAPAHLDYRLSDYAQSFVAAATQRYRHDAHVSACTLDLERDFHPQGVAAGSVDAVVAANVLHATADLTAVLTRLHGVLAPGGSLVLVELTRPRAWLDLTFGLTPGWWRFADDRTAAGHPLLDRASWIALLEKVGFEAARAPAPDGLGQDLIVARKRHGDAGWRWTVTGAGGTMRDAVDAVLSTRSPTAGAPTAARSGLVHLVVDGDAAAVTEDALGAARMALATRSDKLVMVTMGAAAMGPGDPPERPHQAAAFGVARSLAMEAADLAVVMIDADHEQDAGKLAAAVCDAAATADGEDERAIRGARHYVSRLVPATAAAMPLPTVGPVWQLGADGGRFAAKPAGIPAPSADEVVLRVDHAALNFLDVLEATDALPFARPDGPGEECVGVVTAVGDRVTDRRVGDRVMGIARGAMASHVATPAALTASIPDGLSARDAATAPVAYATAIHALRDVAGLTPAHRVLIHSGASGTGLAAVHYALSVGATVYATASPAKWPMLRALGVTWTGSSRTSEFAAALREAGLAADVVLNSLTGPGFVAASLDCLATGGLLVELAKRDIWSAEVVVARRPDVRYAVIDLYRLAREQPAVVGALLRDVTAMMAKGRITPLPSRVFPVDEVATALATMRHGSHVGKVVLDCREGTGFAGSDAAAFDPNGRYLVTGAFGGLGAATAEWMASRGARVLMLAGRRVDERAQALQERLAAHGCRVDLVETDLADPAAARALAAKAAADGRLRGAIHAPGVLADGSVANLTAAQIAAVVGPKVDGAQAMAECWIAGGAAPSLDFFVLFSSAAALVGSPGQANHAAANAVLDAAAAAWRGRGLRTISINWGAWSQIGSARDAESFVKARGMRPIAPQMGLAALEWALRHDHPQLGVLPIDWPRWHAANRSRPLFAELATIPSEGAPPSSEASVGALRAALAQDIPAERRRKLHAHIRSVVAEALGHGETSLDFDRGFTDLGVDSLTAIAIRNRLQRELGCTLGTTFLFDYPNVAVLVSTLEALVVEEAGPADAGLPDLAERLRASLDGLDLPA